MAVIAAWAFPSSSGSTVYETTLDEEGTLNCNCPGFIFKKKGQARGCRHTRQIEPYTGRVLSGSLNPQQVGVYVGVTGSPSVPATSTPSPPAPPATSAKRPGRLIDFEE